jgi:hypothetical protein
MYLEDSFLDIINNLQDDEILVIKKELYLIELCVSFTIIKKLSTGVKKYQSYKMTKLEFNTTKNLKEHLGNILKDMLKKIRERGDKNCHYYF